jgi:integrase/recombinase XerD
MTPPLRVSVPRPLEPYAEGFWAELTAQGYSVLSARNLMRLMAHLSRWLRQRRLLPKELTPPRIERYLRARRRAGYTAWLSERGLAPLLSYLRRVQVVPVPRPRVARTVRDRLLARYVEYLWRERGLQRTTVLHYRDVAGRFLYLEGETPIALATAAPAMAGWRNTSLPRGLEPDQVKRLLSSCDRRTAVGRRDYAILVLLARLGLRRGEVAALRLDDIDWRRGEIAICGKGNQHDPLPLPVDVAEALIGYLRRGRPRIASRSVFLSVCAPLKPLSSAAIGRVLCGACDRARLPRMGTHRLRHTVATETLRRGASLPEVAQVLRHRSLLTTTIYAKVDRTALRRLARPWPGESL